MTSSEDLAARRAAILAAWQGSPTRLREDANAEEDLLHGGYADRLLVELITNAADAGARTIKIFVENDVLHVRNDGAPLTPEALDALTSLRASSKRGDSSTGRFGVGFAAVLAVTDEPEIGGIRFSLADTLAAVAEVPHLVSEAERRGGRVPILRLPFPGRAADGPGVTVRLPLRDDAARAAVAEAMAEFDPLLLLALPTLEAIEVDGVTHARGGDPREVARRSGILPEELLADRPVEERGRTAWWLLATAEPLPQVVHAPTVSDVELTLPVRLVGTFPLDPSRRRIPAGPLTTWLLHEAAETIADLPVDAALVNAVGAGFPANSFDAALHARLLEILPGRLFPGRTVAVADELVDILTGVGPAVVPVSRFQRTTWARLDIPVLGPSEIADLLGGVEKPPTWWRELYTALAPGDIADLGALPVPLTDGRTVTGPKGVLLADEDLPPGAVAELGLRVVHPDAAHPLLERLGARPATPRSVLADERVRASVAESLDLDEPAPLVAAILELVAAAGLRPGDEPWLAELALPASDGEWYPAGELLLPGGRLVAAVSADSPFHICTEIADQDTLLAVGVLDTFDVLDLEDVLVADLDELVLDGAETWAAELPGDAIIERLVAVRDLEWVDEFAVALPLVTEQREALTSPCRVLLPDGSRTTIQPYSRWWLSRHPVLSGRPPRELRTPEATELDGLYDVATEPGAALFGAWSALDDILADRDATAELLDRLGDPAHTVAADTLSNIYGQIATTGYVLDPPRSVRVAPDAVAPAEDVVIIDRPWLLHLLEGRHPLTGGLAVAELLDAPLLSEL